MDVVVRRAAGHHVVQLPTLGVLATAVVLPVKSVGVLGDGCTCDCVVALPAPLGIRANAPYLLGRIMSSEPLTPDMLVQPSVVGQSRQALTRYSTTSTRAKLDALCDLSG